jgi:hypothetical protein
MNDKREYNNFYHYNRNYGCRINEIIYKGYKTLVLENEKLRVSIIVDKGTDIVEFLYKPKDIDFMWRSPIEIDGTNKNPLTKELESGAFLDFYEGGWQEILPNIQEPTNYKGAGLGFHGEIMFLPWKYEVIVDSVDEIKVRFFVRMKRTPFFVEKYITLRSFSTVLEFQEVIKNEADEEFKFTWGQHPAIGKPFLNSNCIIDVPEGVIGQTWDVDFSGNSIFPLDKEFKWPLLMDNNGNEIDLSKVLSEDLKTAFCIAFKNLKEGWYGITNVEEKIGFGMKWDIKIFKYLWMWAVYRGYYNFPFYGRTFNIALEPWSSIPASLDEVIKLNRELSLLPGEELETTYYAIVYESDKGIKGFTDNNQAIKK